MAGSWEDYYNKSKQSYDDTRAEYAKAQTEQENALAGQYNSSKNTLKTQYDTSIAQLQKSRADALKQAYVTREQNTRKLPSLMAAQGLSGGASETALSSLMKNYQASRNSANDSFNTNKTSMDNTYNANLADVENNYTSNLANLKSSYADKLASLKANEDALDMQRAQFLYQIEQNRLAAAAAASSGGGGGGSSGNSGNPNSGYAAGNGNTQYGSSDDARARWDEYVESQREKKRKEYINNKNSTYVPGLYR